MIDTALIRRRFEAVAPFLDERGRRLVAASEAVSAGYGGIAAVAAATGIAPSTIGRGVEELSQGKDRLGGRVRRPGGGRKPTIEKDPRLLVALEALVEPMSRGDPETSLRWTCKSLRRLAGELQTQGHRVSHTLVGELPGPEIRVPPACGCRPLGKRPAQRYCNSTGLRSSRPRIWSRIRPASDGPMRGPE